MSKRLMEIMKKRKSVRSYQSTPVPDDALMQVLEAGRWAPSAFNLQPWEFIVIRTSEGKDGLIQAIGADVEEAGKQTPGYTGKVAPYLQGVPMFIAVVGYPGMKEALLPNRRGVSADKLYATSASLPIGNMLLMASALGLGTVCFTPSSEEWAQVGYRKALGLPGDRELCYILPLGYATDSPFSDDEGRRKPLEEIVYWERYAKKGGA